MYFNFLLLICISISAQAISVSDCIKTGALVTSGYAAYSWLQTPNIIRPSLNNIFLCTLTPLVTSTDTYTISIREFITLFKNSKVSGDAVVTVKNVQKEVIGYSTVCAGVSPNLGDPPVIFLLCRGHVASRNRSQGRPGIGGGMLSAYRCFRDGIVHCPIVTFDYQDSRWSLNFGQDLDCAYTVYAYQQVQNQYPNAKIVLIGDSLGALRIVNFAATHPRNLGGIVLLSPFLTLPLCIKQLFEYYMPPWIAQHNWVRSCIEKMVYTYFCNYNSKRPTIFDMAQQIKNVPIFIGQRLHDNITPYNELLRFIDLLKEKNRVWSYFTQDTQYNHGHVDRVSDMQDALNYFYKLNDLPYDEGRAKRGFLLA